MYRVDRFGVKDLVSIKGWGFKGLGVWAQRRVELQASPSEFSLGVPFGPGVSYSFV